MTMDTPDKPSASGNSNMRAPLPYDISDRGRLIEMMAGGYRRYLGDQDEITLDLNPAWELVSMGADDEAGQWLARWAAAIEATTQEGATTPQSGRMVALKNHPIWQALGNGAGGYADTLGNPWPPFTARDAMNVLDVPRVDAMALGLIDDIASVPLAWPIERDPDEEAS